MVVGEQRQDDKDHCLQRRLFANGFQQTEPATRLSRSVSQLLFYIGGPLTMAEDFTARRVRNI